MVSALGEDIDAETRLLSERVGTVTGSRLDQIFRQAAVAVDDVERDDLGLKRREPIDWRLDRDRRQFARRFNL